MNRILGFGVLLLGLVWTSPAWALDGDLVSGSLHDKGDWTGQTFLICDGSDDTTGGGDGNSARTCMENNTPASVFDLQTDGMKGMPTVIIFRISAAASCSAAYSVDINTSELATGAAFHDVATLDATTTRAVVTQPASVLDRYVQVTTSTTTNCDDLDVVIEMRFKK